MRKRALKMALDCGNNGSHLGGGLSAIEIFAALYGGVLRYDVKNPVWEDRDRLIVSKGHCVLAYYPALCEAGYLSDEELNSFEVNGSGLHGHATRDLLKGIEFSGGSLGLGLPFAVGVALAAKMDNRRCHTYAIVGDGECDEGSIWEAIMSAAHFKLSNLTVIIDKNRLQYDGETCAVMNLLNLKDKLNSFGFFAQEIDGHNISQLLNALSNKQDHVPNAVIANTIKGKGVSFMENDKEWHHSRLTQSQYEVAVAEQPL